ncbi:MAG: phosphate/phosphite/phosphonate ABC transporter substrate-binding protein [Gammaproteobacteria bacterium]|nr:phosphate/phosphite/phosphonate ABC transporter substrate-binding protein [Gammaproteobacteria bacterium]
MKQLVILIMVCLAYIAPASAEKTYVFGRAPQLSAITMAKVWTPFIEHLSKTSGYQIKLKVYQTREEFELDVIQGKLDFFYGNPGYLIVARKLHGYSPLVRSSGKQLKGILVVADDSNITQVEQLQGMSVAFPDENAFAASLYIRSLLKDELKLDIKPVYLKGHDNVYRAIATKRYAAGGGVYRTLERESKGLRERLRVVYETPGMAPHPVGIHPSVPAKVAKAVRVSILQMPGTEEGEKLLKDVKIKKPVAADYDRDYGPVEKLGLSIYSTLLEKVE